MAFSSSTQRGMALATFLIALAAMPAPATTGSRSQHAADRQLPPFAGADRHFRGSDGQPLPFATRAELVEFLQTAAVLSSSEIPGGSTRPKKVLLEKDGVQVNAIFRSFERAQGRIEDPDSGQTRFGAFRDSPVFEAAAYELATLLELPFVPPTARRVIDNRDGTLQLWVESAMSEKERQERIIEPPNPTWWRGVLQTLVIFDNLIFNADRNTGNMLIDADWDVWFVDHTRAFQTRRDLRNPQFITFCERRLWDRLSTVTDDEIRRSMGSYLEGREIGALLRRRARIVEHIEELIEINGEDAVLFDYAYDVSAWSRHDPD